VSAHHGGVYGWLGSDHTSGPLRWLFESIFVPYQCPVELLHHLIRKSGHFLGYGPWVAVAARLVADSAHSGFLHDAFLALLAQRCGQLR